MMRRGPKAAAFSKEARMLLASSAKKAQAAPPGACLKTAHLPTRFPLPATPERQ
jgi:hypothetical protein